MRMTAIATAAIVMACARSAADEARTDKTGADPRRDMIAVLPALGPHPSLAARRSIATAAIVMACARSAADEARTDKTGADPRRDMIAVLPALGPHPSLEVRR